MFRDGKLVVPDFPAHNQHRPSVTLPLKQATVSERQRISWTKPVRYDKYLIGVEEVDAACEAVKLSIIHPVVETNGIVLGAWLCRFIGCLTQSLDSSLSREQCRLIFVLGIIHNQYCS